MIIEFENAIRRKGRLKPNIVFGRKHILNFLVRHLSLIADVAGERALPVHFFIDLLLRLPFDPLLRQLARAKRDNVDVLQRIAVALLRLNDQADRRVVRILLHRPVATVDEDVLRLFFHYVWFEVFWSGCARQDGVREFHLVRSLLHLGILRLDYLLSFLLWIGKLVGAIEPNCLAAITVRVVKGRDHQLTNGLV